jgi:hypothetical protein
LTICFCGEKDFYQNKLGKGTLLIELQTRGVLNKSRLISHGLGLGLGAYRGLPIQEHNGANFGYRAEIMRFPERGSRWCALEVGRQLGLSDIGPRGDRTIKSRSELLNTSNFDVCMGTMVNAQCCVSSSHSEITI